MNKAFNIVIVGTGTAGWFTAAALSKVFKNYKIKVVGTSSIPPIGVGESVTPHVQRFFDFLEIKISDWMKNTGAIFKLANKFQGWVNGDENDIEYFSFTYPTETDLLYKEISEINDLSKFKFKKGNFKNTDLISHLYNKGDIIKFDKFFNSQYHFMHKNVAPFKNKQYLLNPAYSWSQHINAEKCGSFLKDRIAIPNGVELIDKKIVDVIVENNRIIKLLMEDNSEIEGDVFIDASGFHRILTKALGIKEIEYKDFAIDSAIVSQLDYIDPNNEMVNYTQSIAQPHGWQFKIGLYHRMGSGYCFSSNHLSKNKALEHFINITNNRRFEPRFIKWNPLKLETFAKNNLASVGLSSGFYEPLEANSLYVLITGIYELINTLKNYQNNSILNWNEYNKKLSYTVDDISTFIKVHYTLSKRKDSDFWNDMRSLNLKDNYEEIVKEKYFNALNSFDVAINNWSMFPDYMWIQLAIAWGVDTSKWYNNKIDDNLLEIGKHYFIFKEKKYDLITNLLDNNYEWLKENIFENLTPNEWEENFLRPRSSVG